MPVTYAQKMAVLAVVMVGALSGSAMAWRAAREDLIGLSCETDDKPEEYNKPDLIPWSVQSYCNNVGNKMIRCKPDNPGAKIGKWTEVECEASMHCMATYAPQTGKHNTLVGNDLLSGLKDYDIRSTCVAGAPPLDQPCSGSGTTNSAKCNGAFWVVNQ